jgi:FkbM family methyltransferase
MNLIKYENKDGIFYLFPNDAISQHMMRGDCWEEHFRVVVESLLNRNSISIDCGANFGYNSVVMGKLLDSDGKLICFEPQKLVYDQLVKNLNANGIMNCDTYCRCVGERSGDVVQLNQVDYNASWVNIGDTSVGFGGETTETISIDDLNLPSVGFIKIDVQGYELHVLRGARKTLEKNLPPIFIELEAHQLIKFGFTVNDVVSFLKTLGYFVFQIVLPSYKDDYICVRDPKSIEKLALSLVLKEV